MPTPTATVRSAKNGESKGGKPNGDIRLRQAKDGADLPPLAHVVSHHEQNRSQSGQRHKAGQGGGNQKNGKQRKAWTMPATGVRAPERILVAVRAIAPVAGIPPKSGEAILAIPCATSSTFELW